MTNRLLIVEDNTDIAMLIRLHAKDIDCEADIASSGTEALSLFDTNNYQLVILDLMLPEIDGLEVCRRLRLSKNYVPIVMLTSKSAEPDRVLGLEVGADDYITKPFSIAELVARIKAQFRRSKALQINHNTDNASISIGGINIDTGRRLVTVDQKRVELTVKEFDLLLHFASSPGQVFTRMQLLEQVWGYHYAGYEHTVNSHINRLRAKIENNPARPDYVLTVWGVGYRFRESQ